MRPRERKERGAPWSLREEGERREGRWGLGKKDQSFAFSNGETGELLESRALGRLFFQRVPMDLYYFIIIAEDPNKLPCKYLKGEFYKSFEIIRVTK
jgi:hypothetical protein